MILLFGAIAGCRSDSVQPDLQSQIILAETSPLDEFLAFDPFNDPALNLQLTRAETLTAETLIAECMHALGFAYIPDPNRYATFIPAIDMSVINRDWVAEHGLGIVAGNTIGTWLPEPSLESGPNGVLLARMSPRERDEFNKALRGGLFLDVEPDDSWTADDWLQINNQGCEGFARAAAADQSPMNLVFREEFFPILGIERNALWAQRQEHIAQVTAESEWRLCMEQAGFPGQTTQWQVGSELRAEVARVQGPFCPDGLSSCFASELDPSWQTSQERQSILEKEIKLGLANFDCMVATDFQARIDAVQREVENGFIDNHRDVLESFKQVTLEMLAELER
jgi:hypothetical protein